MPTVPVLADYQTSNKSVVREERARLLSDLEARDLLDEAQKQASEALSLLQQPGKADHLVPSRGPAVNQQAELVGSDYDTFLGVCSSYWELSLKARAQLKAEINTRAEMKEEGEEGCRGQPQRGRLELLLTLVEALLNVLYVIAQFA